MAALLSTLAPIIGAIVKALLPALWEIKEKNREAIEVKRDDARYERLSRYKRM